MWANPSEFLRKVRKIYVGLKAESQAGQTVVFFS
jgi:hypothetical protein